MPFDEHGFLINLEDLVPVTMEFIFEQKILHEFSQAIQHEWLETNGIGGWASSTVIGANTRKYHGLLIAATQPPVGRQVLLSKMDETLVVKKEKIHLGCNQYPGAIAPFGHVYLQNFSKGFFPEYTYDTGSIGITKTIAAIHGENTVVIIYEVIKASEPFSMELQPFVAGRDYHSLIHANKSIEEEADFKAGTFEYKPYDGISTIYINVPGADYLPGPNWYYNFEYEYERNRGLEHHEDLFTPGIFNIKLKEGDRLGIIVSTEKPAGKNAFDLYDKEMNRRKKLISSPDLDSFSKTLTLSADQFVVKRGSDLKTIIAGYHWFADWGRDTMISLPGLCLSTKRYQEAQQILRSYAKYVSQGMIPNRFPDHGETPEYNTVDATLWFFVALYKYHLHTNDSVFIQQEMLPVLKEIIEWHIKGTRYGIYADENGLLNAGDNSSQLTWMDAKVGDWVVTPRHGKAVEINALWYNALKIYSLFLSEGGNMAANEFSAMADQVYRNFNELFWNEERECLYDCIQDDYKNDAIRPNQIFALSLPFPLVSGLRAQKVLKIVEEKLYTPVGLRSLSKEHIDYRSVYEGDVWSRDGAYHQGTVWSWLLGPYVDALMEVRGATGKKQSIEVIQNFKYHLHEAGIGGVSEIFDGKFPHTPRGCANQAWGVAEVLRIYLEYKLFEENSSSL